jgi:hypothetical protein
MSEGEAGQGSNEPQEPSLNDPSEASKLAEAGISQEDVEKGVPLEGLDPHDHQALMGIDHWQDIQLKKTYAKWLLRLVTAQLFIADAVFVAYAWAGENWQLEASAP